MNDLNTPILLITYKRLDTTLQVLESISKVKPRKLYVANNAPNPHILEDISKVSAVREIIHQKVDWPCNVITLFRTEHLNASESISSAISWFFEHEEEGIILEDDCVVSSSFYYFAQECLGIYRNNDKIIQISASNLQNGILRGSSSYYYSRYNHIWGWATWKRSWKYYTSINQKLDRTKLKEIINRLFSRKQDRTYWLAIFDYINSWDYKWMFTMWATGGYAILPQVNMVENVGFGADATNTSNVDENLLSLKKNNLKFPLVHNENIAFHDEADLYTSDNFFKTTKSFKTRHLKVASSYFFPGIYKLIKNIVYRIKKY